MEKVRNRWNKDFDSFKEQFVIMMLFFMPMENKKRAPKRPLLPIRKNNP
jgi:hypothetical protein